MLRKIIKIDESKCDSCGICADACHEGAIGIIDGKAQLLRDDFCDGLGACLPTCPTGAISFEEREAAAFDEASVIAHLATVKDTLPCGCPGSMAQVLERPTEAVEPCCSDAEEPAIAPATAPVISQLVQWPIQIKLVPAAAPFFDGARLLVAADCCAFANADFHNSFMKGHVTLIGCPKLDGEDYSQKLTQIIIQHDIKSITVVRMEVPCCAGIVGAVQKALLASGKTIPCSAVTIAINGQIIED